MKNAELKKLIGKEVTFYKTYYIDRVNPPLFRGMVEQVVSKNIKIDGQWYWFGVNNQDIYNIRLA